ncbi:hypothetical protein SEA_PATIO_79 [Gordonia phage Patio]|uniref:Uncharacterized protein n=1 Tax=Gordonia phage Patio TaxID=2041515 RepID=A0A2D2W4N9_9CAUD|nr:hypothetical protein KNT76_gp79 [Gordonia phage Patio]ATS93160.1 hypothetical protein SEA_PATIO_79 [Gordonia phage Patio]
MTAKKKIADRECNADELNHMDEVGPNETETLAPASYSRGGWIARLEPSQIADGGVQIYACELMARDIGRYVRFPVRFGEDGMSMKIVIAELRQISFDGGEVHIYVGAGAAEEFSFNHFDRVTVYGREVSIKDIITGEDQMLDIQNNGEGADIPS